ncbi:MAG: hypothetical protein JW749_11085 [Sedimentisphaerales bacterium]|nr:hypothetical protein [Sedimentisphaerales bacterium]
MSSRNELIREVERTYAWVDKQLSDNAAAGICGLCGKCCDFESYGHKLFVTTPEILYFAEKIAGSPVIATPSLPRGKQSQTAISRCSFQVNHKCTVYPYRFAGCRIFSCKGRADFQSELTEKVIKKFKALCEKFQIPYRYIELPTVLQDFTAEHAENAE